MFGHCCSFICQISHWRYVCRFFDFDRLAKVTAQVTRNLNRIIDINFYPVDTAQRSNMRHRPIGIGVQASWPAPSKQCSIMLAWQSKAAQ